MKKIFVLPITLLLFLNSCDDGYAVTTSDTPAAESSGSNVLNDNSAVTPVFKIIEFNKELSKAENVIYDSVDHAWYYLSTEDEAYQWEECPNCDTAILRITPKKYVSTCFVNFEKLPPDQNCIDLVCVIKNK